LENNKRTIYYAKKEITSAIEEENLSLLNQNIHYINNLDIAVLPPRSKMIIPINISDSQIKENDTLIIFSQEFLKVQKLSSMW